MRARQIGILASITALCLLSLTTGKADVATGNTTIQVLTGISITAAAMRKTAVRFGASSDNWLNFGKIIQPNTSGYVTIAADGTRYTNITVVPTSTHSAGLFNVTGAPGASFYIQLPASTNLTLAGGTTTMTIDTFVANINGRSDGTGILDLTGQAQVHVGGTLHVLANQALGEYDGSYPITYAYN